MTIITIVPIIISSVSLLATVLTFYLTQARPAKISVLVGPEIQAYHVDYPGLSTGMYVPISFINTSPSMGTIFKCGISVFKTNSPEERFFMLWREFQKIDPNGNWTHEEHAHSFAIGGKTSILRNAWFIWLEQSNPKLYFEQGSYTLIVHTWLGKDKMPQNTSFNFHISREDQEFFQNRIQNQASNVRQISLNKDLDRNKILTTHESKVLLG